MGEHSDSLNSCISFSVNTHHRLSREFLCFGYRSFRCYPMRLQLLGSSNYPPHSLQSPEWLGLCWLREARFCVPESQLSSHFFTPLFAGVCWMLCDNVFPFLVNFLSSLPCEFCRIAPLFSNLEIRRGIFMADGHFPLTLHSTWVLVALTERLHFLSHQRDTFFL